MTSSGILKTDASVVQLESKAHWSRKARLKINQKDSCSAQGTQQVPSICFVWWEQRNVRGHCWPQNLGWGSREQGQQPLINIRKSTWNTVFSFKIQVGRAESAWNFTPALRNLHLLLCEALEAEQGWLGTSSCLETRVGPWDVVKD